MFLFGFIFTLDNKNETYDGNNEKVKENVEIAKDEDCEHEVREKRNLVKARVFGTVKDRISINQPHYLKEFDNCD